METSPYWTPAERLKHAPLQKKRGRPPKVSTAAKNSGAAGGSGQQAPSLGAAARAVDEGKAPHQGGQQLTGDSHDSSCTGLACTKPTPMAAASQLALGVSAGLLAGESDAGTAGHRHESRKRGPSQEVDTRKVARKDAKPSWNCRLGKGTAQNISDPTHPKRAEDREWLLKWAIATSHMDPAGPGPVTIIG